MAKPKKFILTPEQREWLKEVFPNTLNPFICRELGCSYSTLRPLVREMGLEKSLEFVTRRAKNAAARSVEVNTASGYIDFLRTHPIPNGEATRFKKGETQIDRFGERAEQNRLDNIRKARRRERARITYGLEQKTRWRMVKMPQKKASNRYWLLRNGYISDPDNFSILYYSEETIRRPRAEATAESCDTKILPLPKNYKYGIND